MNIKLTKWFNAFTLPIRCGWYDVRWSANDKSDSRMYWSKNGWINRPGQPVAQFQLREWRGLAH